MSPGDIPKEDSGFLKESCSSDLTSTTAVCIVISDQPSGRPDSHHGHHMMNPGSFMFHGNLSHKPVILNIYSLHSFQLLGVAFLFPADSTERFHEILK